MNQVDQFSFAVALPHNGFQPELGGGPLDYGNELCICGVAVHIRLAQPQPVQIRAVQHVDLRHGVSSSWLERLIGVFSSSPERLIGVVSSRNSAYAAAR